MRTLLVLCAMFAGAAALTAQSNDPINAPTPGPADAQPPAAPVSAGDPDSMYPAIVGVVCIVTILFAVCYPFRKEE